MIQGLVAEDAEMAGEICAAAFERGLVMETAGVDDQVAKIMPPLTVDEEVLETGLDILESAVEAVLAERFADTKKTAVA